LSKSSQMLIKRGSSGLAYRGLGRAAAVFRLGMAASRRGGMGWCLLIVAADTRDGNRKLVEPTAPRAQTVTEDAKRIAGAADGITAVVVGPLGMVVDGP
jgi:hypothetical protein